MPGDKLSVVEEIEKQQSEQVVENLDPNFQEQLATPRDLTRPPRAPSKAVPYQYSINTSRMPPVTIHIDPYSAFFEASRLSGKRKKHS